MYLVEVCNPDADRFFVVVPDLESAAGYLTVTLQRCESVCIHRAHLIDRKWERYLDGYKPKEEVLSK